MDNEVRAEIDRLRDEETRQNHRIEKLEEKMENQTDLLLTMQKIAMSTEQMGKDLKKQSQILEKQDSRLSAIEAGPGNQWTDTKKTIFNTLVGAGCTAIVGIIGALFYFAIQNLM